MKIPEKLDAWSRVVDLMIRRDGREPAELLRVMDWLEKVNPGAKTPFVVQSAQSLREKYDRIVAQMRRSDGSEAAPVRLPSMEEAIERLRSQPARW